MSQSDIVHSAKKLLLCLEAMKQEGDSIEIGAAFNTFKELIKSHIDENEFKQLDEMMLNILQQAEPLNANSLTLAIETINKTLISLQIMPETIFLLTAPFDEDAKTGDGQYAQSLVTGFETHGNPTKCIWLKQKEGHYSLPAHEDLQPIPAQTIPSVYVLQPVANGRTVVSGYRCEKDKSIEKAEQLIKDKITRRTPQIILNEQGRLVRIGFQGTQGSIIFGIKEVKQHLQNLQTKQPKRPTADEIQSHKQAAIFLKALIRIFEAPDFNDENLIGINNQLTGIKDNYYEFETKTVGLRKANPPEKIADEFNKVLKIAAQDPDRKKVIDDLVLQMQGLGDSLKQGLDIHIRVPDTGAFIMPEDIRTFKKAGIAVNLTIHEYKQNYTRRHLQEMIHDLLREADSVLFFNEKDRKNAIRASTSGDLDQQRYMLKNWTITAYNLEDKAGLTVAAQILSGTPPSPIEVINKKPNILSFGTIRPGKGFDEALTIAKEINQRVKNETITIPCPAVVIAGDPQDSKLMQTLFAERYGQKVLDDYQKENPCKFKSSESKEKREYWQKVKSVLEAEVKDINNPYLELHPWCDANDLEKLKQTCKYVCRLDDMGMRNNGSAIISVLDVGIIYTKWGCVTDKEYIKDKKTLEEGEFCGAVDLGEQKYGIYYGTSQWDESETIESAYKRAPMAREPIEDILNSILERERDQQVQTDKTQCKNYQTVVKAQKLLQEKFALKNSVCALQEVFMPKAEKEPFSLPQQVGVIEPLQAFNAKRYEGLASLGDYAIGQTLFNHSRIVELALPKLSTEVEPSETDTSPVSEPTKLRVN